MLKSTHQPAPGSAAVAPLPPGWTEHAAPSGHKYYYNSETKESTYTRPSTTPIPPHQPPAIPAANAYQQHYAPNLSDPNVANAYMAHFTQQPPSRIERRGPNAQVGREGINTRPKPQPVDKPKSKMPIPGCDPWLLVETRYGRRFAYNPAKNTSYWRIPDKLKDGILQLDQERIRQKANADEARPPNQPETQPIGPSAPIKPAANKEASPEGSDSEYEEVEVTDDEAEGQEGSDDGEQSNKRRRVEEATEEGPAEFSEADIAFQLQAMGQDYGLDPGEYDDGNPEDWPEGADGVHFSEEDAKALFMDLLDDFHINPYNSWEKLIEEGRIIDDPRYTILSTMKARKDAWQEWSKDRVREIRERRAKEEKKDPRIPYMALLQEKATPKLFWAEFKLKFRKEPAMLDPYLKDKDREKWYREHINRLKLPESTRKTDLAALLRTLPLSVLNRDTDLHRLPPQLLTDIKFISLPVSVRDPLIETYIQTLDPASAGDETAQDDEATRKAKEGKQRREQALREHEERVREQKHQRQRHLEISKARLREEERELEMAMQVDKRGLQSQLATLQIPDQDGQ
ncbi:WW domain-containing protein [Plectosphaerella cucumerina]|uniref:WW domain-containing protein n=1 Tax=Plectosphaerella cucumerina TaxID=40658 RepID=A0A8K0T9N7_9PEZI|nr:WW domain-containing protein [Plectosphaerella cucumerina]